MLIECEGAMIAAATSDADCRCSSSVEIGSARRTDRSWKSRSPDFWWQA